MKKVCFAFGVALACFQVMAAQELPSAPSSVVSKPKPQSEAPPPAPPPADVTPKADSDATAPPAAPAKQNTNTSNPPASNVDDVPLIQVRAEEVNVVFTVTDKRGRFIKDVKREDLNILDNKQPIKELRGFSAQTNLPLRVGLLVDASASIRDRFKFEQESAIEFLHQILRPAEDKAFVLAFDSTHELTQPMTNSTEKLSHGIRMIRPGGGTALYDAVYWACRDILLKNRESVNVRRALIVLSDGDDNQSRVTREEAIEMAQRAEVIVYTISTDTSNTINSVGEKVLARISEATGGRSFRPFKLEDVADAFTDIQDELRSQYAIAYKPADLIADGSFRTIDIQLPQKKFKVRARKGYFAPKQ